MTLKELLPQLKALSQEEKLEAIDFLRQQSIANEELEVMDETEAQVLELLEKHPIQERDYGIAGIEAGIKMMEYLGQREKAKV